MLIFIAFTKINIRIIRKLLLIGIIKKNRSLNRIFTLIFFEMAILITKHEHFFYYCVYAYNVFYKFVVMVAGFLAT